MQNEHVFVDVEAGKIKLAGDLHLVEKASGIVLFAHGSGSSRHSPRNQFVAKSLNQEGLSTLLIDLLSEEEEREDKYTAHLRFDIELLGKRLVEIVDWLGKNERTKRLNVGIFGSSTGAAGALMAAAKRPNTVRAVVSRGGRPDLSLEYIHEVKAPTLLIVGSEDHPVIEMNQKAFSTLKAEKKMTIVAKATHLFEEPGTLEEVARLAGTWFKEHL
jgi:dienelactone hydrolase